MAYIGQSIKNGTFTDLGFTGTFNSSTTDFNLGTQVGSAAQLLVSKNGVIQRPGTDYTLATGGTQISFTTAPASGDSIFIVEISGAVGGPINSDLNGNELVLDVDGDTSITADTDDQIDFKTGGTDRARIDSSGNVFIGTTSTNTGVDSSSAGFYFRDGGQLRVARDNSQPIIANRLNGDGAIIDLRKDGDTVGQLSAQSGGMGINIGSSASEALRIDSSGNLLYGTTSNLVYDDSSGSGGIVFRDNYIQSARQGGNLYTNRIGSDGDIIVFHQDGNEEGNIRVSGSTVSYNGFTGTHWSRLSDNSKPTILKGTILESLDEMMDWYQVQFDVTHTDAEGNETTVTKKESYALGDGESVGDIITYTYEEADYQATIIKEGDVKHIKCKISDTSESKAVYGVFMDWDDEDDNVNDMHVAQTGTFVVRLNSSVTTLNKGDLIQSNGDGTGKVQADDIMRASTVAKVLSTTKIETYSDGSYIVPCSLHC
jgi:hypothetical protein